MIFPLTKENAMKDPTTAAELEANLAQFTGSEHLFRYQRSELFYTDGVQYVTETAGAYWLLDCVFSHQLTKKVRIEPFQIWILKVDLAKSSAVLECYHDLPGRLLARQVIEYTDFPLKEIKLYFENSTLCLPSER
jgi:hypothetical protein